MISHLLALLLAELYLFIVHAEPLREARVKHSRDQTWLLGVFDKLVESHQQTLRNDSWVLLLHLVDNLELDEVCDLLFHLAPRFHEVFESIEAVQPKVVRLDDTQLCQDCQHNTLELKMIVDQKLRILHKCLNMLFDLAVIDGRYEHGFDEIKLLNHTVSVL